ncbi:MAG: IS1096 element passenger TnpR family protein [Ardenticatenaceae bacterium]
MMRDDPLDGFLYKPLFGLSADRMAVYRLNIREALNRLAVWLEKPNRKRNMGSESGLWGLLAEVPPIPDDLELAHKLLPKVVETGGNGNKEVQEALLNLIAVTASVESVPFWQETLSLSHKKDRFRKKRQRFTLAALALLAIKHNSQDAYEALHQALSYKTAEVRAWAIHYVARAYFDGWHFDQEEGVVPSYSPRERYEADEPFPSRPIPQKVLDKLAHMALKDRVFAPRFKAREVLRFAQQPVPLDHPNGVYAFKVTFMAHKSISRTIELLSLQTLEELHEAIQSAIEWDNDHLYSFFLNGKLRDEAYSFASPRERDGYPWTDEAIVGELGIAKKHKFLYYFDYGDSHKFEIEVVDIRPQADDEQYPRLVESQGEAPKQYPWQDEEDEDQEWW